MDSTNNEIPDAEEVGIFFYCPTAHCDSVVETAVKNVRFDPKSKSGISEGYSEATIQCHGCSIQFTVGFRATKEGKEAILKGHPGATLGFTDYSLKDEYDEYLADFTPEDPYGVYTATFMRLKDIQHGLTVNTEIQPTFHKMVCLQHIIALEAYLSDRLINILTDHKELLVPLVGSTPALRDQQPRLIEVAKDRDYVGTATKKYLQHFSFHDLANVAKFYKAVLKVDLFKDEEHQQEMLQIIKMRHDLVHRSGRDSDGVDTLIEDEHITTLADHMMDIAARIESAHSEFIAKKYFLPPSA